jgi:hypothetical protein
MGDRTSCTLSIMGVALREQIEDICKTIEDEEGMSRIESLAELEDNYPIHFEEMNYGEMPSSVIDAIKKAGLSYVWSWDHGDDYSSGTEIYDARNESLLEIPTVNGEPFVLVKDLDDPDKIKRIVEASERCDEIQKAGLTIMATAHDKIELVSKNPALAKYLERQPA